MVLPSVRSVSVKDWIVRGLFEDPLYLFPDFGSSEVEVEAPASAEDGRCVLRIVSHEVERLAGLEPLVDGRDLALARLTVKISR